MNHEVGFFLNKHRYLWHCLLLEYPKEGTVIVIAADLDLVSILPLDGVDGDGDVGDGGDVPVVSLLHPKQTNINQPVKINQYGTGIYFLTSAGL